MAGADAAPGASSVDVSVSATASGADAPGCAGGGAGKGGIGTIYIDGEKAGEARIENTNGNMFSLDEGADVGFDEGTNVSDLYKIGDNYFNGKINFVTIEIE